MRNKTGNNGPRGSVLLLAMVFVSILMAFALAFATNLVGNENLMETEMAGTRALEIAQAAGGMKVMEMWPAYEAQRADQRVAWLTDAAPGYSDGGWVNFGPGQTKTTVSVLGVNGIEWVDLQINTLARVSDERRGETVTRRIQRVVRYGLGPSRVFNFVYFANNYGWMYGTPLYLYGAMGANGDLGFSGGPTVDGDLFAATNPDLGAAGEVNGTARHDTLDQYRNLGDADSLLRPTNPAWTEDLNGNGILDPGEDVNGNGKLDEVEYKIGYDGKQTPFEHQDVIDMPYLGDLALYKSLSADYTRPPRPDLGEPGGTKGGIVKQLKAPGLDPTDPDNYKIIIDQTYGDDANENGMYSTVNGQSGNGNGDVEWHDIPNQLDSGRQEANGNLALIGTEEQPIVIMGPVVVSNDLVIKGVVKGQGTFYTGRNLHIVGDLKYSDPPAWVQQDADWENTTQSNKTKDCVGYATRGSVVLGKYTTNGDGWGTAKYYMKPPFTQSYVVDQSDALNGYVTGSDAQGRPIFHGDYTALDGGKRYDKLDQSQTASRRYYESSFSHQRIETMSSKKPETIQGIFYTNHYFGGRAMKMKLYGALITRDEGIVVNNYARFSYDPRIANGDLKTYIELFLPRRATLNSLLWKEFDNLQ